MKRALTTVFLGLAVLISFGWAIGRGNQLPTGVKDDERVENPAITVENQRVSIEQQRFELDRQKQSDQLKLQEAELEFKREQLRVQKSQIIWSALSTIIPLIAVLFTIIYNAWSFRRQTEQLNEHRTQDAALQFELKAAEIAFAGGTPLAVRDRAKALKTMFDKRLSDNFLVDYDPRMFGEREGNLESKKFFLELLLKYPKPEEQYETLCFWKELFPGDVEWLSRVNLSPHLRPSKGALTQEASHEHDTDGQRASDLSKT